MRITASPVTLQAVGPHRELYRQEMHCQIVHDHHHARGFTAIYQLHLDDQLAGYGCIGTYENRGRETIKEFYIIPPCRAAAVPLFRALAAAGEATRVEAQTNDRLLMLMLFDCCGPVIESETVLFVDAARTCLKLPGSRFRKIDETEKPNLFPHKHEPGGDWGIEVAGTIVATGGFLCHYNPPYADVYMEVDETHRGRGYGSYLVQELKTACYRSGRQPAARCNAANLPSRKTLQKAGFLPCARIVTAKLIPEKT